MRPPMFGCNPIPLPGCCATNMCPPVCHPPINYVKHNQFTHIVPHIHPVTETTMNTHVYQNNHYFPHQYQMYNNAVSQEAYFGSPMPRAGC